MRDGHGIAGIGRMVGEKYFSKAGKPAVKRLTA
jgi:hypothetical protein